MRLGDLVKVKGLPYSDYGVIIGTYIRGSGYVQHRYWSVYFLSLEYDVPFMEKELELISGGR